MKIFWSKSLSKIKSSGSDGSQNVQEKFVGFLETFGMDLFSFLKSM